MTGKNAILNLMSLHGISNAEMANTLGISRAALWARLDPRKSDNITVKTMHEMLEIIGYEIVVAPAGFSSEHNDVIKIGDSND